MAEIRWLEKVLTPFACLNKKNTQSVRQFVLASKPKIIIFWRQSDKCSPAEDLLRVIQ